MADTINMVRNGFVRDKSLDFSDDGNRFTGYYFDPKHVGDKRIEASKLVSPDGAFISASYFNKKTGRSTYFDDLNGVSVAQAIEGLPALAKKLNDFLAKLDAEGDYMVTLTAEQYNDVVEYSVKNAINREGDSYRSIAVINYLKDKYGIDESDIGSEQKRQMYKDISDRIRNSSAINPVVLKFFAKELLDASIKYVNGIPGRYVGKTYIPAKDPKNLDDAIDTAAKEVYLSTYSQDKEGKELINAGAVPNTLIYFNKQPDRAQQKIKDWVKQKLENMYDFEWSDED